MKRNEKTSAKLSQSAAKVLASPSSSKTAKSLAASALSQSRSSKQTSDRIAVVASKVLSSDKTSKSTKSLAGSVLTQKQSNFPVKVFPVYGSSLTKAERTAAVRKGSISISTTSHKKK